ncbi:MAG: CUB domain-containing protein, partial [Bacteroidia bacterium]|nr:CUB domain-containing protein [Bacteroidia bacterium]
MKNTIRTFFLCFFCLIAYSLQAQTITQPVSGTASHTINCGTTYTYVDDGGAGGNYSNGVGSYVTFTPSVAGSVIVVTFSAFNTELNFDSLSYWMGTTPSGAPVARYHGSTLPPTIVSTHASGGLVFRFRSDGSVVYAGWVATVQCFTPINITNGANTTTCNNVFYDSGGPGANYTNSENRTHTFTPPAGFRMQVQFLQFNTEATFDVLTVYNGPNTGFPVLGNHSGTTLPPTYTSTAAGGELTFRFISDGTVTSTGWQALITCVPPPPNCATYTAPANGATGISPAGTTLTWNPPGSGPAPTGYKVFFGTDNPPTNIVNGTNIGLVTSYNTGT